MLRAAASRLVDFTSVDPLSPMWWRKLYWLLNEEVRTANLRYLDGQRARVLALMSSPRISGDGLLELAKQYDELDSRVHGYLYPWIKEKPVESERAAAVDAWEEAFGDPDDPAVAARMNELLAWFDENQKRPPPPT